MEMTNGRENQWEDRTPQIGSMVEESKSSGQSGVSTATQSRGEHTSVTDDASANERFAVKKAPRAVTGRNSEIFYINNKVVNAEEIDKITIAELYGNKATRFSPSYKDICKIKFKLNTGNMTTNKGKNYIKILTWCNKHRVNTRDVLMLKNNLAELLFNDHKEANACLSLMENADMNNHFITGFIDTRSMTSKGVITDWPYDIPALWEEIQEKDEVVKIERMTRKVWDNECKLLTDQPTGNFIITMKGNQIRENITIFQDFRFRRWMKGQV